MEPLTAGAIALGLYIGGKFADWGIEKAFDAGLDYAKQKLQAKSPDTVATLAALPAGREDIGVAVLEIEKAAQADPEIKAAVEALGNDVNQAAKTNPQLEKAIQDLTQMVQAQRPGIINENWQGINIKGGDTTINKPNFDFRSK
ncbi:hypothetical protein PI95_000800 [Hassallia byssoidea VB512170]|uniref:Uncharacterized protein n=1 Tax=Hassallia byssoidea VB512170 TaxID=1304833 RepID=A0A846H3K7_9CYAN|nr:hypothetical protein [Hassalia byssoidea]NEU71151.1 hypothetical protein [Hassalia byssoidea VB512170]